MEFGNTSDVIDSLCNIAMASAAVYAAWNAKDWLSPKINEKKFRFADELIGLFCKIQEDAFYLHSEAKKTINIDPDVQGDADKFRQLWNKIQEKNYTYRKNTINLRTAMERMDLWGLKAKNKDEFINIIDAHLTLSYTIEDALSIGASETRFRLQNSFEYDKQISDKYKIVRGSHNKIMKHYNELFVN